MTCIHASTGASVVAACNADVFIVDVITIVFVVVAFDVVALVPCVGVSLCVCVCLYACVCVCERERERVKGKRDGYKERK